MQNKETPNRSKAKQDTGILGVWLPRTMLDALDLKAQYDRCTKTDAVRNLLWVALRLSASTDRRFAKLLENNAIDISPVNLRPRKDSNKEDPTDLV